MEIGLVRFFFMFINIDMIYINFFIFLNFFRVLGLRLNILSNVFNIFDLSLIFDCEVECIKLSKVFIVEIILIEIKLKVCRE